MAVILITERGTPMHHVLWTCTLVLSLLCSGCYDIATWQARTFYGLDCRSEALHNGQCVPVKKEGSHAQTTHP